MATRKPGKPTEIMLKALVAIRDAGGEITPLGGGWWGSKADGKKIEYDTGDWRITDCVGTTTIDGLGRRGLMERTHESPKRHFDTWRITEAGLALIGEK